MRKPNTSTMNTCILRRFEDLKREENMETEPL
jgi:hypothetical protein